jgi:hypothetical protein
VSGDGGGRDRTCDLELRRLLLYPLSYAPRTALLSQIRLAWPSPFECKEPGQDTGDRRQSYLRQTVGEEQPALTAGESAAKGEHAECDRPAGTAGRARFYSAGDC